MTYLGNVLITSSRTARPVAVLFAGAVRAAVPVSLRVGLAVKSITNSHSSVTISRTTIRDNVSPSDIRVVDAVARRSIAASVRFSTLYYLHCPYLTAIHPHGQP